MSLERKGMVFFAYPLPWLLPIGCYRLLLQNADKLYLFLDPAHQPPARLSVVEVALGEVSALRILPQYDSCDGLGMKTCRLR